jgi:protein ImuB
VPTPAAQAPAVVSSIVRAPAVPAPRFGRPRPHPLWYAVVFMELADAALDADQQGAALQRLSMQALAFTSCVSIEPPNALLLEIRGSVKLFGSLPRLHTDIDAAWQRSALKACSATAPSTLAALWLARAAIRAVTAAPVQVEDAGLLPGHLSKVPIACTGWDHERVQTLRAMGITAVGELLRLPRGGLARRLGPETVRDLDIALGRQPAPRRVFVPREHFRERCDFETEIEQVAYLEMALQPLIERCARFLRERQAGVQRLQLKLRHRELAATRLVLGLASITSERRRLCDVLLQRLARLELKAPVRGMELISGSLCALSGSSLDAFAGLAGGRDSAPQLLERLRARLGEAAVYGVVPVPEHRPEAAWQRVKELRLSATPALQDPGMPRPVWLLDVPLPIPEPAILQGPERIESGWWDGKGVARDYYVARAQRARPGPGSPPAQVAIPARGASPSCGEPQASGARLWVFQERRSKRWFLHGVFA